MNPLRFAAGMFGRRQPTPAERFAQQNPLSAAALERRAREHAEERAQLRELEDARQRSAKEINDAIKHHGHWWPAPHRMWSSSRLSPEPTVTDKVVGLFSAWRRGR